MDLASFYERRAWFINQQGSCSSQIQEESMLINNFVTAHQQLNYATNILKNKVSRKEAVKAFKKRVTELLESPKTELHGATRALKEMTIFLDENSKSLSLFVDTPEEPHIQQENLILWHLLNTCWLAVFQRQIESTRNDRRLNVAEMEATGEFVVKFCDGIEQYGLVDYEMGFWEEEILDLIDRCIDKQEEESCGLGPT